MSFHKPEFHETKSERKYYEDKKQKALKAIDKLADETADLRPRLKVLHIWDLVNDI